MTESTTSPQVTMAGRREWTALGVLILPLLLVSMDVSVLYFAVPFISQDLDPSATQQLWIFDIYGFVLAGLLLTMGSLGDRIGRRRLLLIGAAAFSLASLVAAYSTSAAMLIAARAVLGVAGATLMPSTLALIRNLFHDERQRGKAIAVWTAVMTGGVALGPVLSGLLLEHFWWGSVFLINLPAMALLLILGPILLPEFKVAKPGRFDLVSSVLSLLTVLPVIYGIKEWAADGFALLDPVLIGIGCAFGAAFLARQRRVEHPMLDLSLFRTGGFGAAIGANAMAMFAMVGNAVFMTQYLQSVLGQTPLVAALWSLAPSVLVGGVAPSAQALGARVGRPAVMCGGLLVAAAGFGVLTLLTTHSLPTVLVGAGVLACGLVAVMTLVAEIAMAAVRPELAGAASAVLETSSEFGGALGIALLGSIGAAVYTGSMTGALPAGVPAGAAAAAEQTLAGAGVVSAQLPAPAGRIVLELAREAFTSSIHWVAAVGAGLLLATAVVSFVSLRNRAGR